MSSRIGVFTCVFLCLTGCGHGSADHDHSKHEADHGNHGSELQLALDNGEKWQVDEHTRISAAKISILVDSSAAIHAVENARDLAEELDEELDVLVKGCTMTGAAHDQLHVFLVALFPKVLELKEKTDVKALQLTREEIESLLEEYEEHFE